MCSCAHSYRAATDYYARGLIEFYRCHDAGIGIEDQEVGRELTDAIEPTLSGDAAPDLEEPRQLDLGEYQVLRQCLHQPPIKHLFGLSENRVADLQRLWRRRAFWVAS